MLVLRTNLGIEWIQMANKYLESRYEYKYDKWKKAVNIEKKDDSGFEKEFDFIASSI